MTTLGKKPREVKVIGRMFLTMWGMSSRISSYSCDQPQENKDKEMLDGATCHTADVSIRSCPTYAANIHDWMNEKIYALKPIFAVIAYELHTGGRIGQ